MRDSPACFKHQPTYGFQIMQIIKWVILLILLPFISACSTPVQKGFLQNFNKDSQESDGSFSNLIVNMKYDEKNNLLVVSHDSGSIDIWNTNKLQSKRVIKAHKYRANSLAFDGKAFFSSSTFENSTKLWNTDTGELLQLIRDMTGPVSTTPSNQFYVIANSRHVRLFDAKQMLLLPEKYSCEGVITAIATDASSGLIAIGTESGTIEVWQYSEIKGVPAIKKVTSFKPYEIGDWVVGLQFSPVGKSLYAVTRFGSIDEWTSHTLEKRRSLPTTLKYVYSAAFSRDSNSLGLAGTEEKVGSGPGSIEVISLATGKSMAFHVNTNLAVVEFLPPISAFIAALNKSTGVFALPPE